MLDCVCDIVGKKQESIDINKRGFITVLSSGNILPILKYYKELLNINYIFAVGDSYGDIGMLSLAGHSFAINPKVGIEKKLTIL